MTNNSKLKQKQATKATRVSQLMKNLLELDAAPKFMKRSAF